MLASDINNPEFVGAQNPDGLMYVEFTWHEPVDKWASEQATEKAGKKVLIKGPRQPFVRIMRPGDNTSIVFTAVRPDHKSRWPDKWLNWQMQEGLVGDGAEVPGWKLEEWTHLQPEQLRELKHMRFSVVEQVAGASDSQVQRLGIGGYGLREEARKALQQKMGQGIRDEIKKKDEEISDMKARMVRLESLLNATPQATEQSAALLRVVPPVEVAVKRTRSEAMKEAWAKRKAAK